MLGFENSKLIKTRKASFVASAASRQKGAYAVEFALVFVVFFLVLYGMITYGLIFTAQQSMNFAAETGARAGLQWQASLQDRKAEAEKIAKMHVAWINTMSNNSVEVSVNIIDSIDHVDSKKLEVVVSYPYVDEPLIPYLGPSSLLQVVLPEKLESRSSVELGIALDRSS